MTKEVRPTSGKVKGALFSILGNIQGRAFLDLFSGTGRVALHAVERGACPVVAVELIASRAREIRPLLPNNPNFIVLSMDIRRGIAMLRRKGFSHTPDGSRGFNIIFADPPYGAGWPAVLGEMLFPQDGGILAPDGLVVIEHSIREDVLPGKKYLITDRREYGETVLSFLSAAADSERTYEKRGKEE